MINHELNLIFIHPPKTGGWSVCEMFFNNISPQHYSMCYYKECVANLIDLDQYFIFANTRNPWDRMVSAYCFLKEDRDQRLLSILKIDKMFTFKEYVKNQEYKKIFNDKGNAEWIFPNSVMSWITYNGQVCVDYICNLHTLEKDFELIQKLYGHKKIAHKNKSTHDDYRSYYTDELAEMVAEMFKDDIDYFKFDFDDKNKCDFDRKINYKKIRKFLYRDFI